MKVVFRGILVGALLGSLPVFTNAALFHGATDENLQARWAGLGGLRLFSTGSSEAALSNAAALPLGQGRVLVGLAGGRGGQKNSRLAASTVTWSPLEDYALAFSWDKRRRTGLGARVEENLGVAAGLALSSTLEVGAAWRVHQLSSEGLAATVKGASLDLGLNQVLTSVPGLAGGLQWAVSAQGLAGRWSTLAWSRAAPLDLRAGLALRPLGSLMLGFEQSWIRDPALAQGRGSTWSMGLQWQPWAALFLRGGYRGEGEGEMTMGLGWQTARWPLSLDYSLGIPQDRGAKQHRLSVQFSFGSNLLRSETRHLQIQQLIRQPENGKVVLMRLGLKMKERDASADGWNLILKDMSGRVFAQWDGQQGFPQSVALKGDLLPPSLNKFSWYLEILKGDQRRRWNGDLSLGDGPVQLRRNGFAVSLASRQVAAPTLKPILASANGSALSRLTIEMPRADAEKMEGWKIEIKDSQGDVLKTLSGEEAMPQSLSWDGRDRQGLAISDGLGVQLVFSYRDKKGKQFTTGQPVFTQKSFERAHREALDRPGLALSGLGEALLEIHLSFELSRRFLVEALERWNSRQDLKNPSLAQIQAPQAVGVRPALVPHTARSVDGNIYVLRVYEAGSARIGDEARKKMVSMIREMKARPGVMMKVTGLASRDESQRLKLSRQRIFDFAEEMILDGHEGSFVLNVSDGSGKIRGVLVEIENP